MSVTDFFTAYRDEGLIPNPNLPVVASSLPSLFLSPIGTEIPEDGILEYITVDTALDLLSAAGTGRTTVVLIREDQKDMVRVVCEHDHVLGVNVFAMFGVPASVYNPWFDEVTFAKERVSYSPFVSELRIVKDVASQVEANRPKTTMEREQNTYTRKNGSVKPISAAQVSVGDEDEIDYIEDSAG